MSQFTVYQPPKLTPKMRAALLGEEVGSVNTIRALVRRGLVEPGQNPELHLELTDAGELARAYLRKPVFCVALAPPERGSEQFSAVIYLGAVSPQVCEKAAYLGYAAQFDAPARALLPGVRRQLKQYRRDGEAVLRKIKKEQRVNSREVRERITRQVQLNRLARAGLVRVAS